MVLFAERSGWLAAAIVVFGWAIDGVPVAGQIQDPTRFRVEPPTEARVPLGASVSAPGLPASSDALIAEMVRAAGVIFAGEVVAVRRPSGFAGSAEDASEGVVEVDFRVDLAVLGPVARSVYTLREWSGLWTGNAPRYGVGQRLLVFLRAPDGHGLSSPVHAPEGAVPLRGGGVAPGPDDAAVAGPAEWNVDLRWVRAQVFRGPEWLTLGERGSSGPGAPRPVRGRSPYDADDTDGERVAGPERALSRRLEPPVPRPPATAAETEPLSQVLSLCWQAMRQDTTRPLDGSR